MLELPYYMEMYPWFYTACLAYGLGNFVGVLAVCMLDWIMGW